MWIEPSFWLYYGTDVESSVVILNLDLGLIWVRETSKAMYINVHQTPPKHSSILKYVSNFQLCNLQRRYYGPAH